MAIYVDEPLFPYRGQMYCHVWADTVEELHAAAQAAGLKREWFQCPPKADWEHYDCAPRIRAILVRNGAREMDRYAALEHVARLDIASGDPELAVYGQRSLDRVLRIRARQ
jgi:uncharacterized protein DUF4031